MPKAKLNNLRGLPLIAIYVLAAVPVGICLDWAMFGRLTMSLGAFGQAGDEHLYRNTLYPRVFVSMFSSIVFAIGARLPSQNMVLAVVGATVFFASTLYGVFIVMNRGGRT